MIKDNKINFKTRKRKVFTVNSLPRKKASLVIISTINEIISENEMKLIIQKNNNNLELNTKENNKNDIKVEEVFKLIYSPTLGIETYFLQSISIIKPDVSTIILSFIYIDRFWNYNKLIPDKLTLHMLMSSSLYVACSYNEDKKYSFSFFSESVKISKEKLIELIHAFIRFINYRLYVSQSEYKQYETCLVDKYKDFYIK